MNIHHLELFYYVAKHGGISAAVRNIPYGIQQPAVSGQILQLEDDLAVTLFQRRPFSLTPDGEELYNFIRPFFENIDAVAEKLRGGASQLIRIAASTVVLQEHLPEILRSLRQRFRRLKFTLQEGFQPQFEEWLQKQEIDVAITAIEGKPPAGIQTHVLIEVPLILLVRKDQKINSAEELWKRDRLSETLINLPPNESITKHFQAGLDSLKVDWPTGIEVSSMELIQTYVANGFGIGVCVAVPGVSLSKQLKALPLPGFPPIKVGVMWRGKTNPVIDALLEELKKRAGFLVG